MIYDCQSKKVLRFKNKADEFLKAYTTNDLNRPRNAFLDSHGKIIATVDQLLISPEEVLIVIEAQFEERLRRHLEKYLPLYGTEIKNTDYHIYIDFKSASHDQNPTYEVSTGVLIIVQKAGRMILSSEVLTATVTEEEFCLFRVQNQISVQGVDYDQDVLLNIADEEYVSYNKGCYLGQEIIARIHFKGKPSKKLVVKTDDECNAEERSRLTSKIWDPKKSQNFGFLLIQNI